MLNKDNKYHPEFYSHIPTITLHSIMMGCGSILISQDETIMFSTSYEKKLPWGCPDSDSYRIVNQKGEKVLEKLTHLEEESYQKTITEIIKLQGTHCDDFWNSFYIKNPWLKPMTLIR